MSALHATLCSTMVHERPERGININEVENIFAQWKHPRSLTLMN